MSSKSASEGPAPAAKASMSKAAMSKASLSKASLSIAARLTLWYTAWAFAALLGVTAYLYLALSRNLEREDDEFLGDQMSILQGILRDKPEDAAALRQEVEWESSLRQYARTWIRILDAGGRVLAETPGLPPELAPGAFPAPAPGEKTLRGSTLRGPGGTAFRVLAALAPVGASGREIRTIQIALDRSAEDDLLASFRGRALPLLAIGLLACAWVGHRIARRGIRPVEEISRAVRSVQSTTLGERLTAEGWPAELSDLAATFNSMLERLEGSFARISRFSSDIAHELRTPLNNVRGEAEVALSKARSAEEYREVIESAIEECVRLSRLVENLLFLARAEHPETRIQRERVDAGREIEAVREFYAAAAEEAGIALRVETRGEVAAEVDRALLQRAVGNLVENSLAHTPAGGDIELRALADGDAVRIEVSDTGRGIPAEHLPHVFDRLYRADRSRAAATGGAGLGLSIVKGIAELHGGRVEISSRVGSGTTLSLILPRHMTKT
jgi:two-component system heavy metal sensor histidine kinase CusS